MSSGKYGGYSSWAQMIKAEIIELKIRMSALEAKLAEVSQAGGPSTTTQSPHDVSDIRELTPTSFTHEKGTEALTDIEQVAQLSGKDREDLMKDFVEFTSQARMATISMRGYIMLLDQAGLSKDSKKALRQIQEIMLAVQKAIVTIKLFSEALLIPMMAGTAIEPLNVLMLLMAGGTMAGSMAYTSKVSSAN
jgi:hypothetical protein